MRRVLPVLLAVLAACSAASSTGESPQAASQVDAGEGADARAGGGNGADAMATGGDSSTDSGPGPAVLRLPPANAKFDYQLGGSYAPPSGVQVLSRDREAMPAAGLYNICYVNGFQIQPAELATWQSQYPDLVLKDKNGKPIIDANWNEALVDVSTAQKRAAVAKIVGGWIDLCASAGFDAIEIDNLDSYSRSMGKLVADDCVSTMKLFSDHAHAKNLAIAQKNSSELVARKAELGTDFAIVEECNRYSECDTYTAGYGNQIFVIEYIKSNFTTGCTKYPNLSIVLRDLNLTTPGNAAYVYDGC
jgi:hypothetical protein